MPVDVNLAVGLEVVPGELPLLEAAGPADAVRQLHELVDLTLLSPLAHLPSQGRKRGVGWGQGR